MAKRVRISETKRGNRGVKRDANGRFLPGTAPGPGRPAGTTEHREALRAAARPEDTAQVLGVILQEALAGRAWACALYLDRILGRPRVDHESAMESDDPDFRFL